MEDLRELADLAKQNRGSIQAGSEVLLPMKFIRSRLPLIDIAFVAQNLITQ
jgi:hypothetical protein